MTQSSPPGADTARLSHPSTRRPPLPSRRRTLLWPRLTAPRRPTSAVTTVSRATLPSRSSEASTMSPPTAASARPLRTLYRQQHNLGAQLTILQHHLIHDQAVPPCRLYRRQGHHRGLQDRRQGRPGRLLCCRRQGLQRDFHRCRQRPPRQLPFRCHQ
jgi:hypothetical protein